VPVIVPKIDSLDWIPKGARLDIPYDSTGHFDFKVLFQSLKQISSKELESLQKSALHWSKSLSWKNVAKHHINVYKQLSVIND
jgi:hypothetical protein